MDQQWLRNCRLVVGDSAGNGIDLSDLHIRFAIFQGTTQSPHRADIRVYNLSDATRKKIQLEATRVQLQTGYGDNLKLLFQGDLIQKRDGRENATDSFLDLLAADGDNAYNQSVINTTLAAGASAADVHQSLVASMSSFSVNGGITPTLPPTQLARGKVMYGMTRDYLREFSKGVGAQWHVSAGYLNMVPIDGVLNAPAVVLTSQTGLIGFPTQTIDGIIVKCLLNPDIGVGRLLKIDNASIQTAKLSADYGAAAANASIPSIASDGFYKTLAVNHNGDNRGVNWYTDIICSSVAPDSIQPATSATLNVVP